MFTRTLILKAADWAPVKGLMTRTPLAHPLVNRFIAGETIEQAVQQAEELCEKGMLVTLDLLGEHVETAQEAEQVVKTYEHVLDVISRSPHQSSINLSVKPTQFGLDHGFEVGRANLSRLLQRARQADMFVRLDMESSAYTERTVELVRQLFPTHGNTGTVLQSMLRRTPDDVEEMIRLGARVRMVKGAYLEGPDVAHQDKPSVDRVFVECSKRLMLEGVYPAIATHDERIIRELIRFASENSITPDRFEWQMLFGIRRDLQANLVQEGYRLRVYVPYGKSWYPYFTRRLAERPANLLFLAKALTKR